jgi:hypothetical protein
LLELLAIAIGARRSFVAIEVLIASLRFKTAVIASTEAIVAKHGLIACWPEWNFAPASTIGTSCRKHLFLKPTTVTATASSSTKPTTVTATASIVPATSLKLFHTFIVEHHTSNICAIAHPPLAENLAYNPFGPLSAG